MAKYRKKIEGGNEKFWCLVNWDKGENKLSIRFPVDEEGNQEGLQGTYNSDVKFKDLYENPMVSIKREYNRFPEDVRDIVEKIRDAWRRYEKADNRSTDGDIIWCWFDSEELYTWKRVSLGYKLRRCFSCGNKIWRKNWCSPSGCPICHKSFVT